jgi:1-acyl-sn-glycerol-3-phosphate acyltransferase
MLSFLPKPLRFTLSLSLFIVNTLFWNCLLYALALLKLLCPVASVRAQLSHILVKIAELWISCNSLNMRLTQNIQWDIQALPGFDLKDLSRNKSYLIISNHLSWFDIVVLQGIFNRRIPFIRFFLKQELIYVPILNIAWIALDFPFMKRFSPDYLAKHPERRGDDLKATQKACEKFRNNKVSILNFVEGTRFTIAKQQKQEPNGKTYRHLLAPKRGGLSYVLKAMGNQFDCLLDVTLIYPHGTKTLLQAYAGEVEKMVVRIRRIPIPEKFTNPNWDEDKDARREFKEWFHTLWSEKDQLIHDLGFQKH